MGAKRPKSLVFNFIQYAIVRNKRIKIMIDSFIDLIIILSPTVGYFVEQEIIDKLLHNRQFS